MRKVNLPKPEFETSRNSIRLIFKYASINNSTVTPQLEKLIKTVGTMSLGPKEIMTIMGLKDKRFFFGEISISFNRSQYC